MIRRKGSPVLSRRPLSGECRDSLKPSVWTDVAGFARTHPLNRSLAKLPNVKGIVLGWIGFKVFSRKDGEEGPMEVELEEVFE